MSLNNGTLNPAKLLEMGKRRENRAAARGDTATANDALSSVAGLFGEPTAATTAVANAVVNAAATAVANAKGPTTLNVSVGNKKYKAVPEIPSGIINLFFANCLDISSEIDETIPRFTQTHHRYRGAERRSDGNWNPFRFWLSNAV